jgi:carnosine N-methyltransferase
VSDFILNQTKEVDEITIHPHVHSYSNHVTPGDMHRAITIPNVLPSTGIPPGVDFSMVAGDFLEVYDQPQHVETLDAVACCFFLDTAHDVVWYLKTIWRILKPGGVLVNLGPLLYHFEAIAGERSIELSLSELMTLMERMGFLLLEQRTVPSMYAGNARSMLQYHYNCTFFVMKKP